MIFFYFLMAMCCCCLSWQRCLAWSVFTTSQRGAKQLTTTRTFVAATRTQYTIDEPGLDPLLLEKTVRKHWETLSLYLSSKPVANHTKDAFLLLHQQLDGLDRPLILDRCAMDSHTQLYTSLVPIYLNEPFFSFFLLVYDTFFIDCQQWMWNRTFQSVSRNNLSRSHYTGCGSIRSTFTKECNLSTTIHE